MKRYACLLFYSCKITMVFCFFFKTTLMHNRDLSMLHSIIPNALLSSIAWVTKYDVINSYISFKMMMHTAVYQWLCYNYSTAMTNCYYNYSKYIIYSVSTSLCDICIWWAVPYAALSLISTSSPSLQYRVNTVYTEWVGTTLTWSVALQAGHTLYGLYQCLMESF